jgi:CHAT domain-containing protein/tetratricopeptide (TPR) repeat protein
MTYKVWVHKLSFNISRETRWRLAAALTFVLFFGAGIHISLAANSQFASAPAQDQDGLAAQRIFEEGSALHDEGTAESLRLALKKYEEALSLWRAIGDRRSEAMTLNNIGLVYNSLGDNRKAQDFYAQALPLRRATGDRNGEATTLNNIGLTYYSLGDGRKSLDFFTQALPLLRAVGDRRGEAITLNNIGLVYNSLGDNQKALDFYAQSLPLRREVGDSNGEATTLNNIGLAHYSLGDNLKALDYYTQSLPLLRAGGARNREAKTLDNIGLVHVSLGAKQKALDFFNQALPLLRATGDRGGEATSLNNIGSVYSSLGEKRKALDFYDQALRLHREVGDRRGEGATLNNIGGVHNSLGERQEALDFYNQALPLLREGGDRRGEGATLNNIGVVLDSLGEWQKAHHFYTQALRLHRAVGDRSGEALTLNNIGLVNYSLGGNQEALEYFTQALPLSRAVGDRRIEAATLGNIAYVKHSLGRFDESRSYVESALKIIESIRAGVISKELRASYFSTAQEYYEFYVDLLMEMHSRESTRGYDAVALQASERARARSLIESLTEARADIRRGVDPELLAREMSLQQRLNAKAEEALKLSANGAGETRLATNRREMDALTVELQQVQTQIKQTSPRYAALTQPQPLTLAEIQQQALDADTLLLEYSLGAERSFLWAVTSKSVNSYKLPKREVIEAAARRVYEMLADTSGVRGQTARPRDVRLKEAGGQYLAAVADLSRTLLAPVAGQFGKKRLLIAADGMLHYIPFGALPDPNSLKESDGSWQPLLVEHEVVNLPSASTIAVLRRELAGRKPAARTLAMLADPVFSKDDERIRPGASSAARQTAQPDPPNESTNRILVETAGAVPGELRIRRLPFTRLEAEQIMPLVPAGAGMKALDFKANRATAMSEQLSLYRIVHFATHGLADSERPELSTIVLSLYDEQGRPQDGFLRAHEVYNLNLPAELVTLSACETGLGKLTRGEGLVSLTRGFMYAGAARVVVSLWSVNDRATAELMTKFYRRVLVEGERPAAALRAAQVEMWKDKLWEAPYYWAAFTLQGEWR